MIATICKSHIMHVCLGCTPTWLLDLGANDHMIGEFSLFTPYIMFIHDIYLLDGSYTIIDRKGTISFLHQITLHSVLHAPQISS